MVVCSGFDLLIQTITLCQKFLAEFEKRSEQFAFCIHRPVHTLTQPLQRKIQYFQTLLTLFE